MQHHAQGRTPPIPRHIPPYVAPPPSYVPSRHPSGQYDWSKPDHPSGQYDWSKPDHTEEQHVQEQRVSFMEVGRTMLEKTKKAIKIRNCTMRELLAEALGTFILMVFGLSSVAQVVLGKGNTGAHLNAAITITQWVLGNLSWTKLAAYITGQFLGSFMAAATVFALYYDAIYDYTQGNLTVSGPTATAMIFSTYPAPSVSLQGAFFTEFTATVMLILGVLVIQDEKNNAALKGAQPMLSGMLVLGIGLGMGLNTGYAINPSRDLPPRIFTAMAGWGMDVFTADHSWWWVPVAAPILGCLAGVFIYKACIGFHNEPDHETENKKEEAGTETSKL
ncbi:PREDICTED: aquaporin-7 isoform X2 [Corvus brachyrhynchos]|uniref:aquaporin-7 isoform X2 n=1 Tax=Corvus brachyrhynchos TaxID=85066 RepID=UPI0008166546|nr:PREDICTED: aquaporin-7 isoform X2 [Corvus brachyrhynchos]